MDGRMQARPCVTEDGRVVLVSVAPPAAGLRGVAVLAAGRRAQLIFFDKVRWHRNGSFSLGRDLWLRPLAVARL